MRRRLLERADHFIHLRRWAWWVPDRVCVWICDRHEAAIWSGFEYMDEPPTCSVYNTSSVDPR
jgi:hypothetical protein